jgi:hypothetical protein
MNRKYAVEQGIAEEEALKKGMESEATAQGKRRRGMAAERVSYGFNSPAKFVR